MSSCVTIDGWRSNIRFSSAHIIHEYEKCGRLHGHTYAIHIKITGNPDNKGIIFDFSIIKDILREIANRLDHYILIPEHSRIANIKKNKSNITIKAMDKEYKFPKKDCILLPIESTSAENLASYILDEVVNKLKNTNNLESIEIGIDEGYGQGAKIKKNI